MDSARRLRPCRLSFCYSYTYTCKHCKKPTKVHFVVGGEAACSRKCAGVLLRTLALMTLTGELIE